MAADVGVDVALSTGTESGSAMGAAAAALGDPAMPPWASAAAGESESVLAVGADVGHAATLLAE